MITPADWLCARYPGVSQSLILAICAKYPSESEAEEHLRAAQEFFDYFFTNPLRSFAEVPDQIVSAPTKPLKAAEPAKPAKPAAKLQAPPQAVKAWNKLLNDDTSFKKNKGKGKEVEIELLSQTLKNEPKTFKPDPQREANARLLEVGVEDSSDKKKSKNVETLHPMDNNTNLSDTVDYDNAVHSDNTVESDTVESATTESDKTHSSACTIANPPKTPTLTSDNTATTISVLLRVPQNKAETYLQRYKTFERTIVELVLSSDTTCPSPADLEVAENHQAVFPAVPWHFCVRLCVFCKGDGLWAFNVADRISSFEAWGDVKESVFGEAETDSETEFSASSASSSPSSSPNNSPNTSTGGWITVTSKNRSKASSSPSFTLIGDKACAEKVKAAMALDKESKMYDDFQKHYKEEMMNTTDPKLRLLFQRDYDNVKEQNEGVKNRIALLTTPRNESTWYIDLHGLYVSDAIKVAQVKIADWWAVEEGSKKIKPLQLCTGLGSHSRGGFSKIKAELEIWLYDNFWDFEVHKGHVSVTKKIE